MNMLKEIYLAIIKQVVPVRAIVMNPATERKIFTGKEIPIGKFWLCV